MNRICITAVLAVVAALSSGFATAQACPEKNVQYWQAFTAGGESDLAARHQQAVLKKKCPKIETIVQYKPGAGGGLMPDHYQMTLKPEQIDQLTAYLTTLQ